MKGFIFDYLSESMRVLGSESEKERRDSIRETWYENNLTGRQYFEHGGRHTNQEMPLIWKGKKMDQPLEPQEETQIP